MKKQNLKEFFLDPISLRRDVRNVMKDGFVEYLTKDMTVYDIGCGDKPFQEFLKDKTKSYIGVDVEDGFYDASHIDLVGSAYNVPIQSGTADAVISCQVIEHLRTPRDALKEANRILVPNGVLFLSFPFLYPLHAAPHDFYRYSEYGIRELLDKQGFELVKIEGQGGFWYCLGIFFGIYIGVLNKGILRKLKIVTILNMLGKWVFYALHLLEGALYKVVGRDSAGIRKSWMSNYVLIARKIQNA